MIFSAYRLTEDAASFQHIHRYGAATLVLHRLLFAVTPPHHDVLVQVSRIAGSLTLPVMSAGFVRMRPPRWSVPLATSALAMLPIFLRDHVSESNLVPVTLWLSAGLLLLDTWLTEKGTANLLGSLVFLALAATGRPEMLAIVPLLATLVTLARRGGSRAVAVVFLPLALLAIPQALHVTQAAHEQAERGELSLTHLLLRLPTSLAPFLPHVFPLGITVVALLSLRVLPGRWLRAGLLLVALPWVGLLLVDLPETSIPRLEAPLCALVVFAAAWGALLLPGKWRPWLVILTVASVWPTWSLWRPTNEDETEAVWRSALAHLPDRSACLTVLAQDDPPLDPKVHRSVPDYLLRWPHRDVRKLSFGQAIRDPGNCPAGTFALLDHRCWARYQTPRGVAGPLPICAQLLALQPEPVDLRTVPNHGDNEYGYWRGEPLGRPWTLGLYRLR
jgi:hypothetical protein